MCVDHIADFLVEEGDLSGAAAMYREAAAIDPKDAACHLKSRLFLKAVTIKTGQRSSTIQCANPVLFQAHLALGNSCTQMAGADVPMFNFSWGKD